MVFKSKIHESIIINGDLSLKAERNFGWFGNCDIKIYSDARPVMSFHINGTSDRVFQVHNQLQFPFEIMTRSEAFSGDDHYLLKTNRNYIFSGKYGEVLINGNPAMKLQLKQKLFGIELTAEPLDADLESESKLKCALLILANIADLDGSSA